jgi:hypothetical protein
MKIEDLINSIGISVQEAHNAISEKSVDSFFTQHFDSLKSGTDSVIYKPKIIEIALSGTTESGSSKVICVPTAVLATHKELSLDEVKINLNIDISDDGEVNTLVNGNSTNHASTLEIVFKCTDEAEGLARIETQLNGMI